MYIKHIFVVDSSIERHKVGHSMLLDKQFPASLIIYFPHSLFVNSSHLPSMLPVKPPKLMTTGKTSLDSVSLSFSASDPHACAAPFVIWVEIYLNKSYIYLDSFRYIWVKVISTVRCSYNSCIQRSIPSLPIPHIALSRYKADTDQQYCKSIVRLL